MRQVGSVIYVGKALKQAHMVDTAVLNARLIVVLIVYLTGKVVHACLVARNSYGKKD